MSGLALLCLARVALGCEAPTEPQAPAEAPPPPAASEVREGVPLGVPPEQIHRARRESAGLARMPSALRDQTLARRDEDGVDYDSLTANPDAHAHAPARFSGRVGLARPAGENLWILALHTRREGDAWRDPLYVLSVVDPSLPADGGVEATVHGWVVGERTIGRHALPLIVAYAVRPE